MKTCKAWLLLKLRTLLSCREKITLIVAHRLGRAGLEKKKKKKNRGVGAEA
jgi:hypothetical protein